ncbi:hypothetical protein [Pseudoduganella namucuonensis]|nr:hypothetical protein [Pseudoduganella namucuonensis]
MVALLAGAGAQAQTAPRAYAVMSLAGNTLALHAKREQVGTRTESAPIQVLALEDQILDEAAILAARAVLLKALPGAQPVLMMTQDKGLYGAQNAMFDQPDAHQADRDYLKSMLAAQGVSHLVLVSKFRGNAELKLVNSTEGGGVLEGMGFFVDDTIATINLNTQDGSRGMVVPFVYVRVRLLDARTLQVVREATAKRTRILARPSVEPSGMESFAAMTAVEKVKQLSVLLQVAMDETLPRVLAQ